MTDFEKVRTDLDRWTAHWPAVSTYACTMADFGTGQSRAGLGAWPVVFDVGPSQTLMCFSVQLSAPTSRPVFGRVNASLQYNRRT